jgi:hypothetical protein
MSTTTQAVHRISGFGTRYPYFNKISFFKNLAKSIRITLNLPDLRIGRKWHLEDILTVLCYSWIRGVSIHHASEKLDRWVQKFLGFQPRMYNDGRKSRAFPHQTTVNDWLRSQSSQKVEEIYQYIFEKMIQRVFLSNPDRSGYILEFDLTYLGYWGKRRDAWIKGSKMVKGTRRIRHYHGAMIHGNQTSLFIGCHHVANRESKIPYMLQIADWLLNLGLNIKICVIDREYYRHNILQSFKQRGISVITPAKNYNQLKNAKIEYLTGKKGRIQTYFIGPTSHNNRSKKLMRCWVHLYPRGNQSLGELKSAYRQGRLSLSEATDQLYGLVTTIAPQFRSKSFVYLIKRYYKMRWQIETAFRDVNHHQSIWRSNDDGTRLFAEMGKFLLFNMWQFERNQICSDGQLTFQEFRDGIVDEISQTINL